MKKISIILFSILLVLNLSSCKKNVDNNEDSQQTIEDTDSGNNIENIDDIAEDNLNMITLNVMVENEKQYNYIEEIKVEFEQENENIRINPVVKNQLPTSSLKELFDQELSQTRMDIAIMTPQEMQYLVDDMLIRPLYNFSDDFLDPYFESASTLVKKYDKIWAVPFGMTTDLLYYDKSRASQPVTNWSELFDLREETPLTVKVPYNDIVKTSESVELGEEYPKLTLEINKNLDIVKEYFPVIWNINDPVMNYMFLTKNNTDIFTKFGDGYLPENSLTYEAKKSLSDYQEYVSKIYGTYAPLFIDSSALLNYKKGNSTYLIEDSSATDGVINLTDTFEYGALPRLDSRNPIATFSDVSVVVVNGYTPNYKEAYKFIEYISTPLNQSKIFMHTGLFPTRSDVTLPEVKDWENISKQLSVARLSLTVTTLDVYWDYYYEPLTGLANYYNVKDVDLHLKKKIKKNYEDIEVDLEN